MTSGTVAGVGDERRRLPGGLELGYARVSTIKKSLYWQVAALAAAGIPPDRIYNDKKTGATVDRPGLTKLLGYARNGDIAVVHTLDRLGRTLREVLVPGPRTRRTRHRGAVVGRLTTNQQYPGRHGTHRISAARTICGDGAHVHRRTGGARPCGRRGGRPPRRSPRAHSANKIDYAGLLPERGRSLGEIAAKTGIPKTSLYRYLGQPQWSSGIQRSTRFGTLGP